MSELVIGDIYALSALRARGIQPIKAVSDGHRASWVFAESEESRAVLEEYYGRRLDVDALSFSEQVRSAKGEAMHLKTRGVVAPTA